MPKSAAVFIKIFVNLASSLLEKLGCSEGL